MLLSGGGDRQHERPVPAHIRGRLIVVVSAARIVAVSVLPAAIEADIVRTANSGMNAKPHRCYGHNHAVYEACGVIVRTLRLGIGDLKNVVAGRLDAPTLGGDLGYAAETAGGGGEDWGGHGRSLLSLFTVVKYKIYAFYDLVF